MSNFETFLLPCLISTTRRGGGTLKFTFEYWKVSIPFYHSMSIYFCGCRYVRKIWCELRWIVEEKGRTRMKKKGTTNNAKFIKRYLWSFCFIFFWLCHRSTWEHWEYKKMNKLCTIGSILPLPPLLLQNNWILWKCWPASESRN